MQLAEYTGFTEDEVKALCEEFGRDYERYKEWYDGYEVRGVIAPDPNYEVQEAAGGEKYKRHSCKIEQA